MKKNVRLIASVSMLIAGLLPVAALADDGEMHASSTVHVEVDESGAAMHMDEMDHEDMGGHHGDRENATSTKHHEGDHQSFKGSEHENDNNQGDEDDNEIEVDHDSADEATSTVDRPDDVLNRGQLRSFLNHVLKGDEHIEDVHVSSTTVETHYDVPAKFLWAIPAHVNAQVTVNNDGTVSVTYPWYAFLFAKDGELDNKLSQAIASSTANASTTASTTISASLQAHLINAIFSILKGD